MTVEEESNQTGTSQVDDDDDQPKDTAALQYSDRLKVILIVGLLLILFGITFSPDQVGLMDRAIQARFIEEFGFACVIGCVIAYTIERVSRREFDRAVDSRINAIQRNVFRSTYGRNMTEGLVREVEKLILEANFLRHGHRITYHLSKCRARDLDPSDTTIPDIDVVKTEVILWYDVENISTLPREYTLTLTVEKPPYEALKRFVEIDSLVVSGKEYSKEERTKFTSDKPGEVLLQTPVSIDSKKRISVRSSWKMIKLATDVELWRSFLPSDGMTLCVHFPEGTEAKDANAIHRTAVIPRHVGDVYCEWAIEGPVLPQQGILFWWRCGDQTTPADQPAAGGLN